MSKTFISIIVIVLLIAVGVGLWWAGAFANLTDALNLGILQVDQTEEEPQEETQEPEGELTTGVDSSDQTLEEDAAQLDAELESYGEISSDLDQSFEDEPVEQEY